MTAQRNYWQECIAIAADECGLTLTPDQLDCLASSAEMGHEHYGMAFYSPPPDDRISEIRAQYEQRIKEMEREIEEIRERSETAVKKALGVRRDSLVSIERFGEVYLHCGRTERIQ